MSFNGVDFITAILMVEAIIYLSFYYSGKPLPTLFGKLQRAELYQSLLMFIISIDIYAYIQGLTTLLSNSMIAGIVLVYISYLIFGSQMHITKQDKSRNTDKSEVT